MKITPFLKQGFIVLVFSGLGTIFVQGQERQNKYEFPFLDPDLPLQSRVDDLVSRLTLEEKVLQMQHTAPAVERLGIPQYNWWNECLHGVARNGIATVFPQAIGMAATWNPDLIFSEADVISTEARAKYYEAISKGSREIYQGLTFWSPNINIFRDPRWGRGQETYGEDPFLTSQIGKAFVKGLQGNDPQYFKVVATAKHFAVHSGPESQRHKFDAWPSKRDLYETYLPAFEVLVNDARVYSVMTCYNRVFGTPSSANSFLFKETLRGKWGFKGYVVSDCWAISDMYSFHNFVPTAEKAAALSLLAGTDLSCGPEYGTLIKALELGYITENDMNTSIKRLFEARFRLGLFDPPARVKYASIRETENNTEKNRNLARAVAQQSIVLLKNNTMEDGNKLLPFSKKIKTIAVIGPYANDTSVLLGNYNGIPSQPVTLLEGIRKRAGKSIKVLYSQGVSRPEVQALRSPAELVAADPSFIEAKSMAAKADVIVFAGGISPNLEGEEMDVKVPGFAAGDRTDIELPGNQLQMLEALKATGKPIVLVLTNGSALAVNWADHNAGAIVETWYPGEEGGNAVTDVLFGDYNPAGRLPVTFYKSVNDLPAFEDYSMKGRTYKYFEGTPLYAFGFGLSYTSFSYNQVSTSSAGVSAGDTLKLAINISNTGKYAGDEVIQIYLRQPADIKDQPLKVLVAFAREHFETGETKEVILSIPVSGFRHFNSELNDYSVATGNYEIQIGSASDDIRLRTMITVN